MKIFIHVNNDVTVIFMPIDDVILSAGRAVKMIAQTDLNSVQITSIQ